MTTNATSPAGATMALWHREVVRFLRDRSRVTSSLGQPIFFWLLFAGSLQNSFTPGGQAYGEYFFPGTLAMIVMFTAIFATITVIEDRKEGFLQGVLVAPVSRASIALGKVCGAATLALGHSLVFLVLAPVAGVPFSVVPALHAILALTVIAFALSGLGVALAWKMDSTAGYHGVMMLGLMPMLLLSEAFFPAKGAHPVLSYVMAANPLRYGVAWIRRALYGEQLDVPAEALAEGAAALDVPSLPLAAGATVAFAILAFWLAARAVNKRSSRDALT
ncbi:MAG: ABC transporter permease [Planctomycetota bacterium]